MGHFLRDDDGELDDAGNSSFLIPRGLVDDFPLSLFAYRIGVGDAFGEDAPDYALRALVMAAQHVVSAHVSVDGYGPVVLIYYAAIRVTDCNCAVYALEKVFCHFHCPKDFPSNT